MSVKHINYSERSYSNASRELQENDVLNLVYTEKIESQYRISVVKEDFNENDIAGASGCCTKTRLFSGYAFKDMARNKCHFCLAFCSVFVVVVSILVVNTIV